MKTLFNKFLLLILPLIVLNGCKDKCFYYIDKDYYDPVLQPLSDIQSSFGVEEDFTIGKPGNIYIYDHYLLVGERTRGIHILDNSNPASPIPLKFIQLKGNSNFTVVNRVILADNGPDLVSIDISDLDHIQLVNREVNVNTENIRGDKFIVDYNKTTKKEKVECSNNNGRRFLSTTADAGASANAFNTGKGGSMSKFAVIDNYLYIVNSSELMPYNVSNPSKPVKQLKMGLNASNIETLFPYKSYLYMGASDGVHIYNTQSSKAAPAFVSTLTHFFGCDPVIVDKDYAFSTIRGGTACRSNNISALNIYDVKDPAYSFNVRMQSMIEPYGLGIKDDLLFVCQGKNGLYVYDWDISTKNLTFRHNYPEIHAFDVIVNGNSLIVTADNGLFQFDISSKDNIVYLSQLAAF